MPVRSAVMLELCADHPPQDLLQRLVLRIELFAQRLVDHCLVIAAALHLNLAPKPIQHFIIQTDGDASFAGWE
jgi:hypothetical protein